MKILAEGNLTVEGPDCSYVYPDLKTVIQGEFRNGKLVSGKFGKITKVEMINGILKPVVEMDQDHNPDLVRDVSTNERISSNPLLKDLWEAENVYTGQSAIENSGEGLFAKKNLGILACFL